jgi:membrane fusion protein (multidrug efflux system)
MTQTSLELLTMTNDRSFRVAVCALAIAAGAALGGCGGNGDASSSGGATGADTENAAGFDSLTHVQAVMVKPGLGSRSLFTTFLEPVVDAPVVARFDGIVRSVEVTEGQKVAEGDILARMEDDEQRLDWERADALADQAEAAFERAKKLSSRQVISQNELELAEAEARITLAEAEMARLKYERCTLRAPTGGIVRLVRVKPYDLVEEFEILFWVSDPKTLRASLYLPSALRGLIRQGDKVQVAPASRTSGDPVTARVRLVNPVSDPVTGLFRVEMDVPVKHNLAAGMDVIVSFGESIGSGQEGGGLTGAVLPSGAYIEKEGGVMYAYQVKDGVVRRVGVQLGAVGPDGIRILSGLSSGDIVLASGQVPPPDGHPVRASLIDPREQ